MKELTDNDKERYARQIILDGFGVEGQMRLKGATVFIAGAGGLGSAVSTYLAASGVGTIKICDHDLVELSNLNRQVLHTDKQINTRKALSAKKHLRKINPTVRIKALCETIDEETVMKLVGRSAIIVDCMDNLPTRLILNKCAVKKKIPFVFGSVSGLKGYVSFFHVPDTPCLECIFQDTTNEGQFPVIGATPGVIGSLQAMEVIKYLTGVGVNLKNQLLIFDGVIPSWKTIQIAREPHCLVCGR